ncbi:hypothetical protein ACFQ3Z_34725 [Streptomyces nogalater]
MVAGQPGLGKTAFAVHAAHLLAPHFPDGQFALDLHGMDPEPTTPGTRWPGCWARWGSPTPRCRRHRRPRGLWRSLVGDRRVLLLLDNAADEAQVAPCCPAPARP